MTELKQYLTPEKLTVVNLDSREAYDQLAEHEKQYLYYMYRACWAGARIVARQCSDESNTLLDIVKSFTQEKLDNLKSSNVADEDKHNFLNYFALVSANLGNYRSFGDSKILPRIEKSKMKHIFELCFPDLYETYSSIENIIYDSSKSKLLIGYNPENINCYHTANMTKEEVDIVDEYIVREGLEGWNTRVSKLENIPGSDSPLYSVEIASAHIPENKNITTIQDFKGLSITISYGDHSDELKQVCKWLEKALEVTNDPVRERMLVHYLKHFAYGGLADHKESQKWWIKDKGPVVETNIGFIENYRDPAGMRAEFEGFVAIVDKKKSEKLQELVRRAPEFIKSLPWPKEFEKDEFNPPDFTALDVVTFCNSGVPAGINIPNYDEIRMNDGFKNVSLDNVIRSAYGASDEPTEFLSAEDDRIFREYILKSFAVDVAGHELIGHGSGKLFNSTNFSKDTINPLTGSKVTTWYGDGETWGSKFGRMGSAYEECRAECVGLYLSCNREMHKIFGHTDGEWEDIMYTSWIWMIRAGIVAMEHYDPEKNMWMQAHSQARYVIYKVMEEAGECFVSVDYNDARDNFTLRVDRSKIVSVGIPALKKFLLKLGVYKSTADFENGSKMFNGYSALSSNDLNLRHICLDRMKPRAIKVQPVINSNLDYIEYPNTPEGMILSVAAKLD